MPPLGGGLGGWEGREGDAKRGSGPGSASCILSCVRRRLLGLHEWQACRLPRPGSCAPSQRSCRRTLRLGAGLPALAAPIPAVACVEPAGAPQQLASRTLWLGCHRVLTRHAAVLAGRCCLITSFQTTFVPSRVRWRGCTARLACPCRLPPLLSQRRRLSSRTRRSRQAPRGRQQQPRRLRPAR